LQVADVFYTPQQTSDNPVKHYAVRDLTNRGSGDVRKAVGDVVAVASPQARLIATANDRDSAS
jgi:hypothetical protein